MRFTSERAKERVPRTRGDEPKKEKKENAVRQSFEQADLRDQLAAIGVPITARCPFLWRLVG